MIKVDAGNIAVGFYADLFLSIGIDQITLKSNITRTYMYPGVAIVNFTPADRAVVGFDNDPGVVITVSFATQDGDICSGVDVDALFGIVIRLAADDEMIGTTPRASIAHMDSDAVVLDGIIRCAIANFTVSDGIVGAIGKNISIVRIMNPTILHEISIDR